MSARKITWVFHFLGIIGGTLLLVLVMSYPFLPGSHDGMAATLSAMVQAFGVLGLLWLPIGMLWGFYEWRKRIRTRRNLPHQPKAFWFALISIIAASVPMLGVTGIALGSTGKSVALVAVVFWICLVGKLVAKLKRLKHTEPMSFNPAPVYLVLIPILLSLAQLVLARPLTVYSRNRAMASAEQLIREIEKHRTNFGQFPRSLQGVHADYSTSVVGIPQYHYALSEDGYNLFFEQPLFIFDKIGTREFVVYNKLDQHVISSHAVWNLEWTPEQLAASQGWYAAHDISKPHWKSFLFD